MNATSTENKRILVLGGGFAGLWSAIGAARKRVSAGTLYAELKHVVALTKPVACSAKECRQARYTLN